MENKYLMIVAVACLFCFLLYQEIKRVNKHHLFFRIAAVAVALLTLLFLILPLTYKVAKQTGKNELLLLSAGTSLTLTSGPYFTTDSSVLQRYGARKVTFLPDLPYYLQAHPEINRLKIYGYGLNPRELEQLKNYQLDFYPEASATGITAISWPQHLQESDFLTLQGVYHHTSAKPVKLVLTGLGTKLDSVVIKSNGKVPFKLKTLPKQVGRAVYKLVVTTGTDTLEKEAIPFEVTAIQKAKILVLSSFPDFEYKFLKNWLYASQYQVVFRTRVSKDKFSEDQLNTRPVNSAVLNTALLGQFDLVIADDEELANLNPAATASLRTAIGNGLGLLIRLNTLKSISPLAKAFKTYAATDSNAHSLSPVLNEGEKQLKPLLITQDFYLQEQQDAELLVKNQAGKILLSTNLYGNGKITASAMAATYNWMLTKQNGDYAQFWSHVIRKTAKKQELASHLVTLPALPLTAEQLALVVETNSTDSLPAVRLNQAKVSPLQHSLFPFSWKATYWPKQSGWNELQLGVGEKSYFYVYPKGAWKAVRAEEKLLQNLARPKGRAEGQKTGSASLETTAKEISKWWFYLLFLIAVAYLWFETKLL